jgi:glycine betaine/proline transport system permease protein
MKELLLKGLRPEQRFKGLLVVIAVLAVLLIGKTLNLVPDFLDELPQHSSRSSHDIRQNNLSYEELVPVGLMLDTGFYFLRDDLGLMHVTRFLGRSLKSLIEIFQNILMGGRKGFGFDAPPWTALLVIALVTGYALKGWRLALLAGGTVSYFAIFGLWKYSMQTLSLLMASVPISIAIGLVLGIMCYRKKSLENVLLPLLGVMQTVPHFAYLIPVFVFFGVGTQTGVIATIIFAVPPMVRLTLLGLKKIPPEIVEAGKMSGCTSRQLMFRVQLPTARNEIMLGVNQVIMQCLAMVVIAAFIGADGLGFRLLNKLNTLKLGASAEIGIAIVLLAVVLDRLSRAWAEKKRDYTANLPLYQRYKYPIILVSLLTITYIASSYFPVLYKISKNLDITFAPQWDGLIDWVVVNFDAEIEGFRYFVIGNLLSPMRDALLFAPFISVMLFVAGIGLLLGGYYSALLTLAFLVFIGMAGWWDRAMITAYMVLFATFICIVIGIPLGIWSAIKVKRAKTALFWCDTFQTFPSFIYIIPVIMLFQVNDFSAIMCVILYSMVPAVRYTIEGLKSVPVDLHEAVTMAGCNKRQRLFQLELPLALPHIMLGVNQTVMFAFSMVIIAAWVGTIDLGQAIFGSLSESDIGKGVTLGLCVSFMALLVDHLINRWVRERRALLGMG